MGNHAVKYGLYYAGASIAISLLFWLVMPEMIFNMSIGFAISIIVPLIFMYLAIRDTKNDQEGYISFGECLKASFLTYIVGSLLAIVFSYVLMNFIDPSLLDLQKQAAIQAAESMSEMFGAPEEAMEEMREQLEEEALDTFSVGQAMMGWLGSLVFPGLILALIMSGVLKKNA